MATITAINRPNGQTGGGLYSVIKYVMQDKKTVWNGEKLVSGQLCIPKFSYNEMMATKMQWNKTDGKMYFHFVHSFSDRENITPKQAHEMAVEFAKHWKGFEVVIATHSDTDNVHTHFIINSVNCENGKKYHCDSNEIKLLQSLNDELCIKYGYSVVEKKKTEGTKPYTEAEYRSAMRGESWKLQLQLTIDNAMKYAVNRHSFFELMASEGYSVKWTADRKNITYTCPNGMKCRDSKLHEKKYLKEMMEYEFFTRRKYFESTEGTPENTDGTGKGHGKGSDGDGEKLVRTHKADNGNPEPAVGNGGNNGNPCHGTDTGRTSAEPGAPDMVTADIGNIGSEESTGTVQPDTEGTVGKISDGDIITGWEEERRTLFSLLGTTKSNGKMAEKASSDKSNTFSSAHYIAGNAVNLAGNLSGIINEPYRMDFADDDDIDKRLREEIWRIKNGQNIEM